MNKLVKKGLAALLSAAMLMSAVPVMAADDDTAGDTDTSLMSLIPIEEKEAALVLNGYTEDEIKAMPLSVVLSKLQDNDGNYITIPDSASVLWAHFKDEEGNVIRDEYHEIGRNETVDLSEFSYTTGYTMELIIGSANQLDTENVRYIVKVYISDVVTENLNYEIYSQSANGTRTEIIPDRTSTTTAVVGGLEENMTYFIVPNHVENTAYYLGISSLAAKHPNVNVDVYTYMQYMYLMYGVSDESITEQILNQDMKKVNSGYLCVIDKPTSTEDVVNNMFVLRYTDGDGNLIKYEIEFFYVVDDISYVKGNMYSYENGTMSDIVFMDVSSVSDFDLNVDDNASVIVDDIVEGKYYMLNEGYLMDDDYYLVLTSHGVSYGDEGNSYVEKAVVGLYDSLEDASNQEDIKDQLLPTDSNAVPRGYKANYSYLNGGVQFTVFYEDGTVYKLDVRVTEYDPRYDTSKVASFDNAPIIGQADPYFRITGLKENNSELDTYIIENGGKYNLDTYYGLGYQTILINDANADLSKITPEFWPSSEVSNGVLDIYEGTSSGGSKQESGEIEKDFSNGALQYSAVWQDDSNKVRNYQVSVVKKQNGPKLYVNGPDKREIFLDDYFEQKHDIFIANIGDEELQDLKVELIDAKNVKLDDYWTVGGESNDTLAAFTTTSTVSDYSELPNVAKIRLLPSIDDKTGKISGILKISSNGGEREIELTGQAVNPDIVTTELADAVKYVPYQRLIMTNNMHEWNDVSFELVSGELPDGVALYPNGEIYGVPTETGTFNIKVKANYSRDAFESSEVELSLTVKDNTDENVDAETDVDDGYGFKTRFPDTVTGEKAETFEIEHDYDETEFKGVWLDGEKLVENVDYTVEKGSTKITIASQTISNTSNGSHTIAAEYRNSNNEVKKSAQNYTKTTTTTKSGGGGSSTPSSYKVWLEVNGGVWLQELTVKRNAVIENLPTPERAGYAFGGWFTDEALTQPFDVNTKINKTTTLYAKWIDIYTIWFIENGGEEVSDVTVQYGDPTPKLPTPIKEGYIFDGWYADENLTKAFNDDDEVLASMSLYAKWRADVAPDTVLGFDDIHETDWFYNDVNWAYNQKFMVGVSNQLFAPNESVTGGMVVTVLSRIADADVNEYGDNSFADVYENEWYTPYAKWAKAIGLVDGIPFNPPKEISREWMGIIIVRFLDYMDIDYEITDEYIKFADADEISTEAEDAIQTLYKIGIFKGKGANVMDPQGNTTRAEFAALMQRTVAFMR